MSEAMQPTDNADVHMDQIIAETGVSKPTISSWIRRGWLEPGTPRADPPRADGYVITRHWWPRRVIEQVRALAATADNVEARREITQVAAIQDPDTRAAIWDACWGKGTPTGAVERLTHAVLRHLHMTGWPTKRLAPVAEALLVRGIGQQAIKAYAGGFSALRDRPYLVIHPEGDVEVGLAVDVARWALPAVVFRVGDEGPSKGGAE